MAKTPAPKKGISGKPKKTVRSGKPARPKPTKMGGKARISAKSPSRKAMKKPASKPIKSGKSAASTKTQNPEQPVRTRQGFTPPPPPPEPPPPLLRESKSTVAALVRLEKGIKALYQKDFKRARAEFNSLEQDYPGETEILARARTYRQICAREEAAHKKPTITNDQLYSLGVIEHNRGNYDGALAYFQQSLAQRPDSDYIHYSIASSLAMKGDALEAIQALRKAIELNEDNRIYAKNDSDFLSLQVHKEFTDLVGLTPASSGVSPE